MNCIIVDDEPLAREAIELLGAETGKLQLSGTFNSAAAASLFMEQYTVDLVFLDIQMPDITGIEAITADEYFFVKADRRYFKVNFADILFIEGLKDYVILQLDEQRIITRMSLKAIFDLLPKNLFLRVNKSYIVNTLHIASFDNNDIFIKSHEIAIGNSYRDAFFEDFVMKKKMG